MVMAAEDAPSTSTSPYRAIIRAALLGLLVAVLVWCAWFVLRQSSRSRYFTDNAFREIAVLAEQLEGAIASRHGGLRNWARSYGPSALDAFMKPDIGGLVLGDCPVGPDGVAEKVEVNPRVSSSLRQTGSIVPGDLPQQGSPPIQLDADVMMVAVYHYREVAVPMCGRTTLSALARPFVDGNGFDGAHLFVARGSVNGAPEILLHRGNAGLRVEALAEGWAKENAGAVPLGWGSPAVIPKWEDLARASQHATIEIGDRSYHLFSHPLRIKVGNDHWVLGMLVPQARFSADVSSMSLGSVSTIPLLLLLLVLGAPLVKVIAMGQRDRLRAREVRLIPVSLLGLGGIAAALVCEGLGYGVLDRRFDHELETLSQTIRERFTGEIRDAVTTLGAFAALRGAPGDEQRFAIRLLSHCQQAAAPLEPCRGASEWTGQIATDITDEPTRAALEEMWRTYPYFDMLVAVTSAGQQRVKWSTKDFVTPPIPVDDHRWFDDLRLRRFWADASSWQLAPGDGSRDGTSASITGLVLHVMRSPNTGGTVSVLARQGSDSVASRGAAAIVPDMITVAEPVLPDGFRFAIVERDGRVVYHSTPSRSLYENFFEELDRSEVLQSTIHGDAAAHFDAHYRGRSNRFYVHPLGAGSPWSLLVFRDREMLRAISLDVLLTWFLLFAAFLSLLAIARVAVRAVLKPDDTSWYWPDAAKAQHYDATALSLAAIAVFLAGFLAERPEPSIASPLAILAALLAAGAVVYLRLAPVTGGLGASGRRQRRRLAVMAFVVAALCAIAAVSIARQPGILALALLAAFAVALSSGQPSSRADTGSTSWAWALVALAALLACGGALQDRHVAMASVLAALAVLCAWRGWGAHRANWEISFVIIGVLFLVVAGVLPSAAFYQDAFEQGMEIFVRQAQVRHAAALDRRTDRLRQQYSAFDDGGLSARRLDEPGDVYSIDLFGALADDGVELEKQNAAAGSPSAGFWARITGDHFSLALMEYLPVYHAESVAMRHLGDRSSRAGRWFWTKAPRPGLSWPMLELDGGRRSGRRIVANALPPTLHLPPEFDWRKWFVVLALLVGMGFTVTFLLLRWLADGVFELNRVPDARPRGVGAPIFANGALLLGESEPVMDMVNGQVVDLADPSIDGAKIPSLVKPRPTCLVACHLEERLQDIDVANLEKQSAVVVALVAEPQPLLLCSRMDPLSYLRRRKQSPSDQRGNVIEYQVIGRWARGVERLMRVRGGLVSPLVLRAMSAGFPSDAAGWASWRAQTPGLTHGDWSGQRVAELLDECSGTPRLRGIAWEIWATETPPATLEDVVTRVRDAAGAHYRAIWSLLTDEEQLTLVQVAREGFVSPKNRRTVHGLQAKGLLRWTPALRPMSESFARFVTGEITQSDLRALETAEKSSWSTARTALVFLVMAGGLFLYLTEPQGLLKIGGLATTFAGGAAKVSEWFEKMSSAWRGSPST